MAKYLINRSYQVHNVEILVIPKEEYFKGLNDIFDQAKKGDYVSHRLNPSANSQSFWIGIAGMSLTI